MGMATALQHALRHHLQHLQHLQRASPHPPQHLRRHTLANEAEHSTEMSHTHDRVLRALARRCCPPLVTAAISRCCQLLRLPHEGRSLHHAEEALVDACEVAGLMSLAASALGVMLASASASESEHVMSESENVDSCAALAKVLHTHTHTHTCSPLYPRHVSQVINE
jgi:hypothetical protein